MNSTTTRTLRGQADYTLLLSVMENGLCRRFLGFGLLLHMDWERLFEIPLSQGPEPLVRFRLGWATDQINRPPFCWASLWAHLQLLQLFLRSTSANTH